MFAAVVEEERESAGLNRLIANGMKADSAIFGEPCGLSKITIGYRGHVQFSIQVLTQEGHSSAPQLAVNAIEASFSLYNRIKQKLVELKDVASTSSTSVSLTEMNAGVAHNVIPGSARMTLDIRIPLGKKSSEIIAEVQSISGEFEKEGLGKVKLAVSEPTEPYRTKMDFHNVRSLGRTIQRLGYGKPSFILKSGTGDMNTYALAFGIEAVTYGPGDTKLSHTSGEFMDVEEVLRCARVLTKAAFDYFELGSIGK